jgi:hypothetical protein
MHKGAAMLCTQRGRGALPRWSTNCPTSPHRAGGCGGSSKMRSHTEVKPRGARYKRVGQA